MSASGFSPRQRRIVILMVLIVVVVFGLLTGFLITSLHNLQPGPSPSPPTPVEPTSPPPSPTPRPATSTPAPEGGIWPQVRAARLFDQIARQVEMDRALSPKAEVPLSFLDEHEMEATLQERYAEDGPTSILLPLTALGLLPDASLDVQAQSPVGIYVLEQQQLYVASDHPENDPDGQTLLAHAYVHALQDQHFDLEAVQTRAPTSDQRLAVQALIEGDATLATALYRGQSPSSADWEQLTDLVLEAEQPRYGGALGESEAWARLQRFPNEEGRAFASAVFEHGGWDAINGCYTHLPRSTEQILHPTRYLGQGSPLGKPDQPTTVVVPDLDGLLGEAWVPLLKDTVGEFAIGLRLNQVMPAERAWDAADGWDGDTLVVWEREDGRRLLVWRTIWDSSAEAVAFERGLRLLIPQRYVPLRPIDPPQGEPGSWWEGEANTVHLRRAARYVLLVVAPDTDTAVKVSREVP